MTEIDDSDAQDAGGHVPRINQLDAATLDEELLSSFHEQISEAFRYFIRLFCQLHKDVMGVVILVQFSSFPFTETLWTQLDPSWTP